MKIVHVERLIDAGGFSATADWQRIEQEVIQAIGTVQWPPDSGSFTLRPESGKRRGEGNGVTPIKDACMLHLQSLGWDLETRVRVAARSSPGPIDATCEVGEQLFCVEWETGNVSSSHRALNKLALGMLQGTLLGGILIIPSADMYPYLTDRIGNYPEIAPYFPLWKALPITKGLLAVMAIEQDDLSWDVPRIGKGTDGRALQ